MPGWARPASAQSRGPRRGFRETWAYGLPLLTLDHVWLAPGWRPLRCERLRLGSDHLAVKVELSS